MMPQLNSEPSKAMLNTLLDLVRNGQFHARNFHQGQGEREYFKAVEQLEAAETILEDLTNDNDSN